MEPATVSTKPFALADVYAPAPASPATVTPSQTDGDLLTNKFVMQRKLLEMWNTGQLTKAAYDNELSLYQLTAGLGREVLSLTPMEAVGRALASDNHFDNERYMQLAQMLEVRATYTERPF